MIMLFAGIPGQTDWLGSRGSMVGLTRLNWREGCSVGCIIHWLDFPSSAGGSKKNLIQTYRWLNRVTMHSPKRSAKRVQNSQFDFYQKFCLLHSRLFKIRPRQLMLMKKWPDVSQQFHAPSSIISFLKRILMPLNSNKSQGKSTDLSSFSARSVHNKPRQSGTMTQKNTKSQHTPFPLLT